MRLIDADELCELANNSNTKSVDANDIMRFPKVDAIPIDMLKDLIEDPEIPNNLKFAYNILITAHNMADEVDKLARRITDGQQ